MPQFYSHSSLKARIIMRLIILACIFLLLTMAYSPGWAGEALVNSDVEVDVTGKDAADARAQAMAKAQVDALTALLNKLTTPEHTASLIDNLDGHKISGMVRGTEVLDEKMSANRYHAHLMVTFDGDQVSQLIGNQNAAAGEQVAVGSFLILPAYEEAGVSMLWEEVNPWRAAWKSVGLEITSGDIGILICEQIRY